MGLRMTGSSVARKKHSLPPSFTGVADEHRDGLILPTQFIM